MELLTVQDLKPLDEYERSRQDIRQWMILLKRSRRISVGDCITLVFENRDTIWFQIQEMLRAEHIVDVEKIRAEVEVYNQLMPRRGQLSATLMIEITDKSHVKEVLDRLHGLDREKTVWLRIGLHRIYGIFEKGHSKEDKVSAVHHVRFPIPERVMADLANHHARAVIGISHPNYRAVAAIPHDMRIALLTDLE